MIIPEEGYISLINDVKVLNKILKSSPGKDLQSKVALKEFEKKSCSKNHLLPLNHLKVLKKLLMKSGTAETLTDKLYHFEKIPD